MSYNRSLIGAILFVTTSITVNAQTSVNSPYTRYGLGDLTNSAFANNIAMGGVGYALRNGNHINIMNPASYTAADSLSFKFDVGMGWNISNFKEGGYTNKAKNSTFDYIAMQFRLHPRIGFTLGFVPYSTVGYNFSQTYSLENGNETTATNTFTGDGGLQQVFLGLGFKIFKNLSVGANIGYFYGTIDYQSNISFSTTSDQTVTYNHIRVKSYKADFGLQYTQDINKDNNITLGLSYGLGHDLNSTGTKGIQVTNYQADEISVNDQYGIPHSFGGGRAFNHNKQWTVDVDYTKQQWSKAKYENETNRYNNLSRIAIGAEFTPNSEGRGYLQRIHYRAGAYYNNSYLKMTDNIDGPSEYGVSVGLGFPLQLFQRNTILNITGQYVHVKPSVADMLSENRFVIKLGLTFNERWFMKWRIN